MKAVILAAGRGTRLETITRNKPKCLVNVNGVSILDRQIRALLALDNIEEIIVVCGYRGEQIKAHIANNYAGEPRLGYIENSEFHITNNMYSLFLTRDRIAGHDIMLMNADVAFDPSIVRDLSEIQYSAVCVDVGKYAEESMKVILDSGRLTSISKTVPPDEALGVSIDVYRFSGSETDVLLSEAAKIIEQDGNRNEWTELAMDRLMSAGTLNMRAFDIGGRAWYEIDNMEDLHQAEALFGRTEFDWESVDVAFVDMDGTLFNGNLPITGADRFFKQLTKRVQNVFLLSNNSSKTHAEYVSRLAKMGISADEKQILLSSDALIAFLKSKGVNRVYTVGTASFIGLLAALGINNTGDSPEAVVLGYDTELTYEKLQKAALLLHNLEMPYYATHLDVVCPTESGDIPDIGAMTKLIEATTERLPDITFGKPSHGMVEHVYKRLGIEPQNSVFFGDRVYTDYELANACGARFIGLLSGDAERADFEKCRNITVFGSVAEVFAE